MGALLTASLHFLGLPAVLGTEPRAMCMLGKCFPHELPFAKGCGFFLLSVFFYVFSESMPHPLPHPSRPTPPGFPHYTQYCSYVSLIIHLLQIPYYKP